MLRNVIITLFALALTLAATVHDNPEVRRIHPWEYETFEYHAFWKIVNQYGVVTSQYPAPDQWINMIIVDDESSGGHTHGSDANPRPSNTPVAYRTLTTGETVIRLKTDATGTAVFRWKGNGFSGTVTTQLVSDDIRLPVEIFHTELRYVEYTALGSNYTAEYLQHFPDYGDTKSPVRHEDSRHLSVSGLPIISRNATINTLASVELLAQYYRKRDGSMLDYIRLSLEQGGCADNKQLAGGTPAYQYLPWQYKACNSYGVALELENPAIDHGGVGSVTGDTTYGFFVQLLQVVGCKLDKFQDDGVAPVPITITQVPNSIPPPLGGGSIGVNAYWHDQPVNRVVCSIFPRGLQ